MKNPLPVVLTLLASSVVAQEKTPKPDPTPLRVQLVVARHQGEKKLSGVPFALGCGGGAESRVRLGVDVPLHAQVQGVPQVVFKTVGWGIGCESSRLEAGVYALKLEVDQTFIHAARAPEPWAVPESPAGPALRSFRASFTAVLRDGQTAQYVAAPDPVSGEVVKVDVTLSVGR